MAWHGRGITPTIREANPGAIMQASLALAGFLLGMLAWWQTGKPAFLVGALLMLAPWPWTLLVIKPTNDALLATKPASAGAQTRAHCHMGSAPPHADVLGALAVLAFLYAIAAGVGRSVGRGLTSHSLRGQ